MEFYDASEIEVKAALPRVKYDFSLLSSFENVSNVRVLESESNFFIAFDLYYDEAVEPVDRRISWPEPIALEYSKIPDDTKCPHVWAIRNEFPKDLPHLNPVGIDEPASICLWRNGGNQALYQYKGINGFVDVLCQWMDDAQCGRLQHDGWEPTPRSGLIETQCSLSAIQNYVHKHQLPQANVFYGKSILRLKMDEAGKPEFGSICLERAVEGKRPTKKFAKFQIKGIKNSWEDSKSQLMIITPPRGVVASTHNPLNINTVSDFHKYCDDSGLSGIKSVVLSFLQELQASCQHGVNSRVPLLIAQKRPIRLIDDIPDLADGESGKIDVICLLVSYCSKRQDFEFQASSIASQGSKALWSQVSGGINNSDKNLAIVGCGAIGANLAELMGKEGEKSVTLVDSEIFSPHNVARHVLGKQAIGYPKSLMLERYLTEKYHTSYKGVFGTLQQKFNHNKVQGADLIVDATANPIVADWLDKNNINSAVKCYISGKGNIGVFMSKSKKIMFFDIETVIFMSATREELIENWLKSDTTYDSKVLGVGCGSDTLVMPYSTVQLHTAYFQALIKSKLTSPELPGLFINTLSDEKHPTGAIEILIPEFQKFDCNDWKVVIDEGLLSTIESSSRESLPNEACGYLIGRYSYHLKRITVVAVTSYEQADVSPTSATLPPVDTDQQAKRVLENSCDKLIVVGTWHSHPTQSAKPSTKDQSTLSFLKNKLDEAPQPYIMLINSAANSNKSITVIEPEAWT